MRLLIGLALWPTAALALLRAGAAALPVAAGPARWPFAAGFLGYAFLHLVAPPPRRLYVFGHELTHALAAVLHGGRVRRFVVGSRSGHVELDRSNVFISLAPYCLPLYAVGVLCAQRLLALWLPPDSLRAPALAALGVALAFHLLLTLEVLTETKQSDLDHAGGVVFSTALVVLANAGVVALTMKLLSPADVSLASLAAQTARGTAAFWAAAWDAAQGGAAFLHARLQG